MKPILSVYQAIPAKRVADVIHEYIANYKTIPLVSVGSGSGEIEYLIRHFLKNNIICIDPAPESFRPYPKQRKRCIKPHFPTVNELIMNWPRTISNCNVLLYWPDPENSLYDVEAIHLLKPKNVILIYEVTGGAAGFAMHCWLNSMGIQSGYKSDNNVPLPPYQKVFENIEYSAEITAEGYKPEKKHLSIVVLRKIN